MRGWLRKISGQTVIVNLRGEVPAIKGVLIGVHADVLVLRDPIALDGESETSLDGSVIVLRESVDFVQVP